MTSRIAVLASGGGSNLQAILDYFDRIGDARGGSVVLVASDRRTAGALERAAARDVPTAVLHGPREPAGERLDTLLARHEIDLIVLAGFLKLVPPEVIAAYDGRVLNIHPSLLPAFGGAGMYGMRVHRAVIESGVRVTGVTAHFVNEVYDRGQIIAQWPVPVFAADTPESVAARVLRVEHLVFPLVVDAVAGGRTTLASCTARGAAPMDVLPAFTLLAHEDSRLAENIELALGC